MGLLSGACWAWSLVSMRRTEHAATFDKVFVQFLFLGPSFLVLTLVPGAESWAFPRGVMSLQAVGWLSLFGLVWMHGAIWLTVFGGSRIDPGRAAVLLMLEVVVGLVSAAMLANEPLHTNELVGAALILGSGAAEFLVGPRLPR